MRLRRRRSDVGVGCWFWCGGVPEQDAFTLTGSVVKHFEWPLVRTALYKCSPLTVSFQLRHKGDTKEKANLVQTNEVNGPTCPLLFSALQ